MCVHIASLKVLEKWAKRADVIRLFQRMKEKHSEMFTLMGVRDRGERAKRKIIKGQAGKRQAKSRRVRGSSKNLLFWWILTSQMFLEIIIKRKMCWEKDESVHAIRVG